MQGASAIQAALRDFPTLRARVLVVWEPVLLTDWSPPSTAVLSRIWDRRAVQFWDKDRLVSQRMRAAGVQSALRGATLWDFVALFPPGARWDASFPPPPFRGAPVVSAIEELRRQLYSYASTSASYARPKSGIFMHVPKPDGSRPRPEGRPTGKFQLTFFFTAGVS